MYLPIVGAGATLGFGPILIASQKVVLPLLLSPTNTTSKFLENNFSSSLLINPPITATTDANCLDMACSQQYFGSDICR